MKRILLALIIIIVSLEPSFSQKIKLEKISQAAIKLTKEKVSYDPTYYKIAYPNGDIPKNKGVCTDVIIRTYRQLGIDLQKEVHEDMKRNFHKYPKYWGLKHPDTNIDHRRVPNLMTFFTRYGKKLKNSKKASDYKPGEIVCWNLGQGITHIGIVINKKSNDGKRYLIVHNIGNGQEISDCLFSYTITGHYLYNKN
ncbi:DUF1287 domain-containing protein [Marinilabiliaceae bacterium JC040]|nr:DUF1287 domain-containing protein [Marinilabiliaceae bacterium JC040]